MLNNLKNDETPIKFRFSRYQGTVEGWELVDIIEEIDDKILSIIKDVRDMTHEEIDLMMKRYYYAEGK